MQNPFESGHIKNYLLLYASVVVIMVLFFVATSLFHDIEDLDTKSFNTEVNEEYKNKKSFEMDVDENRTHKFKLLSRENNYLGARIFH